MAPSRRKTNERPTRSATPKPGSADRKESTTEIGKRKHRGPHEPQAPPRQLTVREFSKLFNTTYQEFYRARKLSERTYQLIQAQQVDMEFFVRLTNKKKLEKYISLYEGTVIFHPVPNSPHGELIGRLHANDMQLTPRTLKRPGMSFGLQSSAIPNPPPTWLKFLPQGHAASFLPSIVAEVNVTDESPSVLLNYAQKYFSESTSVRIWVGVKVWLRSRQFWVGWGERQVNGSGCQVHSSMAWPPNSSSINTPVNIIYRIPMTMVYGPGLAMPPDAPATLDIDVEEIRQLLEGTITYLS